MGILFFLIIDGEGKEAAGAVPLGGGDGGENVCVVHGEDDGAVGEARDLPGLDGDGPAPDLELLLQALQNLPPRSRWLLFFDGEWEIAADGAEAPPREGGSEGGAEWVCSPPESCCRHRHGGIGRGERERV